MASTAHADSPLAMIGLSREEERLYRSLLKGAATVAELAATLRRDESRVTADADRLVEIGLVSVQGDEVSVLPPDQAIGRLIAKESRRLERTREHLELLRELVPTLTAQHLSGRAPRFEGASVEVVEGGDAGEIIGGLMAGSTGELLWLLRPEDWPVHGDPQRIAEWTSAFARSGRRSRAIYPARVLEGAPELVRTHAESGQQVRILASVPMQLVVLGESVALIPREWGRFRGHRLVVREPALVMALREMFEGLWARAMTVPGLDTRPAEGRSERRLVLDQLARGAKDEQIARALGLSLRTVRRRVAEILDELGATSRFEAGVEAVRRGWL